MAPWVTRLIDCAKRYDGVPAELIEADYTKFSAKPEWWRAWMVKCAEEIF